MPARGEMISVVASSSALATATGIDIREKGGNAFDAAVAASVVLGVVEPMASGVEGDLCGLVWPVGRSAPLFLDGIGRTSASLLLSHLQNEGFESIGAPRAMAYAMTVPGAVSAWFECVRAFGSLGIQPILAPAIEYCDHGFVVPEHAASSWERHLGRLLPGTSCSVTNVKQNALRERRPIRRPDLRETLLVLSERGPSELYGGGTLGKRLIDTIRTAGGCLTLEDLASHKSRWQSPLTTTYNHLTIYQAPPPTQGALLLLAIRALERLRRSSKRSPETRVADLAWSLLAALTKSEEVVVDMADATANAEILLHDNAWIDHIMASGTFQVALFPSTSDTSIVVVIDGLGNAISLLTSLYLPFGSGLCVDGSGIVLHNRAASFSLAPGSRSILRPGAQPPHTLMPGLLAQHGTPYGAFGVIGGAFQPQGNLQILHYLLELGLEPQKAVDQARFRLFPSTDGGALTISVEAGFDETQLPGLSALGLTVEYPSQIPSERFGSAQLAFVNDVTGGFGASDSRSDGAVAWA